MNVLTNSESYSIVDGQSECWSISNLMFEIMHNSAYQWKKKMLFSSPSILESRVFIVVWWLELCMNVSAVSKNVNYRCQTLQIKVNIQMFCNIFPCQVLLAKQHQYHLNRHFKLILNLKEEIKGNGLESHWLWNLTNSWKHRGEKMVECTYISTSIRWTKEKGSISLTSSATVLHLLWNIGEFFFIHIDRKLIK